MSPARPRAVHALLGKPVAGNPTEEMVEAEFAAAAQDAQDRARRARAPAV